jgi:DNA mismatch endonuclease, patch repair protein
MDNLTPLGRRRLMQRIGQRNTAPEKAVRSTLRRLGIRFSSNHKRLPGTPDLVLNELGTVIFVHGCFWHRHSCRAGRSAPTTNKIFWEKKFRANKARDRKVCKALRAMGWRVVLIWECHTRGRNLARLPERVRDTVCSS